LSWNEKNGLWCSKTPTAAKRIGLRAVVEVELSSGKTLRCTEEHLVLTTNRGWVQAGRLTVSDDVRES
jgi:intein/homing endonuclease